MEKEILEIEVEAVKIIGKIKGVEDPVELVMDKETYFDWRDKLINEKK